MVLDLEALYLEPAVLVPSLVLTGSLPVVFLGCQSESSAPERW